MQRYPHRGDIYWIRSRGEKNGSVQQAGRPGIIVSNDRNNKYSDTVEIIYLTTAAKHDLPTHCTIRSANRISTALCEQITTVSKLQIGNYISQCTKYELGMIEQCIRISIGI